MIKIPEEKYMNLQKKHLKYIKKSVRDTIQFYINTCDVIRGTLKVEELSQNITPVLKKNTIKSFLAPIVNKKYRELVDIKKIFDDKSFNFDFFTYTSSIKVFFEEMLNPKSNIYMGNILSRDPEKLMSIYIDIVKRYSDFENMDGDVVFEQVSTNKGAIYSMLEKIFNYDRFREGTLAHGWGAYELCKELNINVCPYCNRMYTYTVVNQGENITRPELDHYFPRSKFPIFSLSFFNLIPSCKICNSSIKKDEYLEITKYLHPYMDSLNSAYKFDFLSLDLDAMEGKNKNNKIFINRNGFTDEKSDKFLDKFLIEQIYEQHRDIIPKYIKKHKCYPDSTMEELSKLLNIEKRELLINLYNPIQSSEVIDTSLGKFNLDIYDKFMNFYK
ncbi:HNH endonuclease [Bacillus cereus]|uniref:HNH endonuclease n=1 Tax=Bacillus cereus TaxID=1396 RepID=UPI000E6C3230|nr:hypothetical protein [Bacillus cereus]RJE13256.1 hypothetical protein C0U42_16310 [Bacillus cereus]